MLEEIYIDNHKCPHLSSDICVIAELNNSERYLLVIDRKYKPLGKSLPGGHVDYGERLIDAAYRELYEETGLNYKNIVPMYFVGMFDDPERDPRKHIISALFCCFIRCDKLPLLVAGDDAKSTMWIPLNSKLDLIADHNEMVISSNRYLFDKKNNQ